MAKVLKQYRLPYLNPWRLWRYEANSTIAPMLWMHTKKVSFVSPAFVNPWRLWRYEANSTIAPMLWMHTKKVSFVSPAFPDSFQCIKTFLALIRKSNDDLSNKFCGLQS